MNLAPVLRFALSFVILAIAVGGGYFSSDPASKTFLYGASIMLLLPVTLAALLDVARGVKVGARCCGSIAMLPQS